MKYVIAMSGPVAVGKTALTKELENRFLTHRISTREMLVAAGAASTRASLIDKGKALDRETDGTWIRDRCAPVVMKYRDSVDVILIDAVRTERQIFHLRETFGDRFVHIHVAADLAIVSARYAERGGAGDTVSYDEVRADSTESGVWDLGKIADRVVVNELCGPRSLLARAVAGLGLFPLRAEPSVDVIISAQYGSEGKGHICAHLAKDYQVLVRVGGPNAGHNVAYPKYNFRQLPSGTQANESAKILIAAGSTIWPERMMEEIRHCGLTPDRLVIDEQAMVIEDWDRRFEETKDGLGSIGSTKQGAGAALARKILNRGATPLLGDKVRLAKDHPDLRPFVGPVGRQLEDAYAKRQMVMLEGTQGTDLSIHHGIYPNVTARETTAAGCLADAGIAPARVRKVVMVTRRYPIRVGGESGEMGIEINAEVVAKRSGLPVEDILGTEIGSVSGNPRRIAEFDWEQVRRSAVLNGATDIALTFSDYITKDNRAARRFDQLSDGTRAFIAELELVTNVPVSLVSTRFHRFGIVDRRNWG